MVSSGKNDKIQCSNCGKNNPADASTCANCGAPLFHGEPPTQAKGLTDWLSAQRGEVGEPKVGDLPAWLTGGSKASKEPTTPDAPDWLPAKKRDAEAPPPASEPPPGQAAPGEDIPEWLQDLGGPLAEAEDSAAPPPPADIPTPSAPDEADQEEVSDWLLGLGEAFSEAEDSAAPPPPADTPASSAPDEADQEEVPDWLFGLGDEQTFGEQPPEPSMPVDDQVPDWLSDIGESIVEEQKAPEEPPSAGETEQREEPLPETDEEEVPDWLPGPEPESAPPEAAAPSPEKDTPDWLADLDLDGALQLPTDAAPAEKPSDGLLGFDFAPLGEESQESTVDQDLLRFDESDIPEWMKEEEEPSGAVEPPREPDVDLTPELLQQIEGLRFESITGEEPGVIDSKTERVGALKDLSGIIRAEMIFEGESLQVGQVVEQVIVTKDQSRRIEMLNDLLAVDEYAEIMLEERQPALPVARWLITLVLLIAVSVPALLGFRFLPPPPDAPQQVVDAQSSIARLPQQPVVVLAFEYEPDTAAEIEPLALALLDHIERLDGASVYALSSRTLGPAMIKDAYRKSGHAGDVDWINLGYISGRQNGIAALTIGGLNGLPSPLEYDHLGARSGLQFTSLVDLQPDMLIVLAARLEDLQPWIEQTEGQLEAPLLAAVSAGAAPMAYPYQQSGQLAAVLSGVNDAAAYRTLDNQPLYRGMATAWNAQAAGGLATTALIVISGVLFAVNASRKDQE